MKRLYMMLLLLLLVPITAAAADYEVLLPEGYEEMLDLRYPVLYLMPQDGGGADESGLAELLARGMAQGRGMSLILVRPALEEGRDPLETMAAVVEEVDARYRTAADPAYRAAAGTGTGGYLAYALLLQPDSPFGAAASIRGDFTGQDNPWLPVLGSIQDGIRAVRDADRAFFDRVYTYMDAPAEDAWTDQPGGTDDLGAMMIGFGTGSANHEFTVRPGGFDESFLAESAGRVLDRLTRYMLAEAVKGSLTPDRTSVTDADEQITAAARIIAGEDLAVFAPQGIGTAVCLAVNDPVTGECLSRTETDLRISMPGMYDLSLSAGNAIPGEKADCVLSLRILGTEVVLDTVPVFCLRQEAGSGEISLAGDWHFRYLGTKARLDAASLTQADFADWSLVQPGRGNWTRGYGNISDENVTSGYGPDYFDFFITGSGYYARTFTVPDDLDLTDPVLCIGYADDRCEVFVNGVRAGATGLDDAGRPNGETTWAVFSHFDLDPALLRRGEENLIVVRVWNDTPYGLGGWYEGPACICSREVFEKRYDQSADPRFFEETFESAYAASAKGEKGMAEVPYLIYLPEGYEDSDRSYPTVYLLHQFNSDYTSYRNDGIREMLDQGIASGLYDPVVVVMPDSDEDSWWRGDWEKMITEELVPHIDSRYRTVRDSRWRMTAGCSMGGQGAYGIAMCNPGCFSGAVSFYGAFSYGGSSNPVLIASAESAEYMDYFSMYFCCGNQDNYGFGVPAVRLHQQLKKQDVPHRFFIENGTHESSFYLPYFQDAFAYVRSRMMHSDPEADSLLHGSVVCENGRIRAVLTADPDIAQYMNRIPDSSYTRESSPPLSVPLTLEIRQENEKTVVCTDREAVLSQGSLTAALEADLPDTVDPDRGYTVVFRADLFDRTIVVAELEHAPQ